MKDSAVKSILFLLFCVSILALWYSGLLRELTFERLQYHREALRAEVHEHYLPMMAAYIALYIVVTALALPGAAIMSLAGGYLFGMPAVVCVNLGATAGASTAFLLSRYLAGDWVRKRYGERLSGFNKEVLRSGHNYLLSLRLITVIPFFLINILSGLTSIRLSTFIWTTSLGILPGSMVFVYAGTQLAALRTPADILSPGIVFSLVLLALFALLPALLKHRKTIDRNKG